ncbi:MAG: hypothetical protein ABH852_00310, partial [Methanobacteriota archaeon]
ILVIFPYGEIGFTPRDAEGTVKLNGLDRYGLTEEPTELTFKKNKCVEISGSEVAEDFKAFLKKVEGDNLIMAEFAFGFNPKNRWNTDDPGMTELYFGAGTLHTALGCQSLRMGELLGDVKKTHIDGIVLEPTLTIGGKKIIDRGKLVILDRIRKDPKARERLSRYGDPDQLLKREGKAT